MQSKFITLSIIVLLSILLISCAQKDAVPENFETAVQEIQKKYAPDKRIALFQVEYNFENDVLQINVETDNHDAIEDIKSAAENLLRKDSYELKISKLPAAELGDSSFAIVNVSVANLRRSPKNSAELIDQSVMGTALKILKRKGYWYLVQTPYKYIGWTGKSSFERCSKDELNQWKNSKQVKVINNYAQVFSGKKSTFLPICDAVYGSEFKYIQTSGTWYLVSLPDGKQGFIEKKYCRLLDNQPQQKSVDKNKLLKTAESFLGIPYLWGGNSTKGFDCSGFTQTVFKSQGIMLPRDANMQVNIGNEINPKEDFSNLAKGDLIFFGPNENRITHVAISLGGPDFIHSSGNVHMNSLDKNKENFNEYRFKTLRYVKRIVN